MMKAIDILLNDWSDLNVELSELKLKKDELECGILEIMKYNRWENYNSPKLIMVSLIEEEMAELDTSQLRLFMSKEDVTKITKHSIKKRMIISTRKSRNNITKNLKGL